MLQATLIGNLGADCEFKEKDGSKFVTFRVAHNESWTDEAGNKHESSQWIDCVLNDHPRVAEYLKAGTLVFVSGTLKTRVYSSAKDRCMKAGVTIKVRNIELLGGKSDVVPTQLVDDSGLIHQVNKYYQTDAASCILHAVRGGDYQVDAYGWVRQMAVVIEEAATSGDKAGQPEPEEPKSKETKKAKNNG